MDNEKSGEKTQFSGFTVRVWDALVKKSLQHKQALPDRGRVLDAIERVNRAVRKRISIALFDFYVGLKINQEVFTAVLRNPPAIVPKGGPHWQRLAASSIVQCNVDVERFLPRMLLELHRVVIDSVFPHGADGVCGCGESGLEILLSALGKLFSIPPDCEGEVAKAFKNAKKTVGGVEVDLCPRDALLAHNKACADDACPPNLNTIDIKIRDFFMPWARGKDPKHKYVVPSQL
jgi:hypothetical protein